MAKLPPLRDAFPRRAQNAQSDGSTGPSMSQKGKAPSPAAKTPAPKSVQSRGKAMMAKTLNRARGK